MTRIFQTEYGFLQQKESGRTILITKDSMIDIQKMPRKVTEENAEEIAKAMINAEKRFSERWRK